MATLEDYEITRRLLLDVFDTAATGGLTTQIRETVKKLQELHQQSGEPVTRKKLADALELEPRTVGYRVTRAISLGYIVNLETRERQPAKLIPGDPMPEERPALPSVEELEALMCGAPPECDFHVSTLRDDQIQVESNENVEDPVETGVSTSVSTLQRSLLDLLNQPSPHAWKRGSQEPDELHTRTCSWLIQEKGRWRPCGSPAVGFSTRDEPPLPLCAAHSLHDGSFSGVAEAPNEARLALLPEL